MKLLKKLTQCNCASGSEEAIGALIENEIKVYTDEVYTDALGNFVAHKKGTGKKIMLAAHMDEIGIVVTYIDDKGFLRFSNVGGLYTKELIARRVQFSNGTVGVIYSEKENKDIKMSKLYIDIGAVSRKDAENKVSVGDTAVFMGEFTDNGTKIISKALDNRAGCYVLIEAAKKINSDNDIYYVFTSQEEVGLRGARTAAYEIEPQFALAVDVTDTGDTPNGEKTAVYLGGGAAIKIMDRSVICHQKVRNELISLAKEKDIPYQLEVMTDGGTDAGVIHYTKEGVMTGGVSIPVRYIHSPSEMADKKDIEAAIELVKAFAEAK